MVNTGRPNLDDLRLVLIRLRGAPGMLSVIWQAEHNQPAKKPGESGNHREVPATKTADHLQLDTPLTLARSNGPLKRSNRRLVCQPLG